MFSQREASEAEQYELIGRALEECVRKGVSKANLLYLCWATGYNVKHLEQIKKDVFGELVKHGEGRN